MSVKRHQLHAKRGQAQASEGPRSDSLKTLEAEYASRPSGEQSDEHSSRLLVLVVATALRSLNECLYLVRELPQDQPAVLVLIHEQKVSPLMREMQRLLGLWRLLHPVLPQATYRASNRRLKALLALLSNASLALCLERFAGHVRPDTRKNRRAIEDVVKLTTKFAARMASRSPVTQPGLNPALSVAELTVFLEQESSVWRGVPTTDLAQGLVLDRGFLRTYRRGQGGLRRLIRNRPRAAHDRMAELARWQSWVWAFAAQLSLFARGRDDVRQRDYWYVQHLAESLEEAVALLQLQCDPQFARLSRKYLARNTQRRAQAVMQARLERLRDRQRLLGRKVYDRTAPEFGYDMACAVEALESQSALNMLLLA